MVQRVRSNENEWQRMTSSSTTNDNEWYNERQRVVQQVTTNDNKLQPVIKNYIEYQQMTTNDKKNEYEWEQVEGFFVSKETKGQCGRPMHFLHNFIQLSMQYITTVRTSRSQMFFEIVVLKVCNIYRKAPVLESFFSKVTIMEVYKSIKKRLQHRCFPVNIYLKNTAGCCFCTWNSQGIWSYKSGNWWHTFSI